MKEDGAYTTVVGGGRGGPIGLGVICYAPWIFRRSNVLRHYTVNNKMGVVAISEYCVQYYTSDYAGNNILFHIVYFIRLIFNTVETPVV